MRTTPYNHYALYEPDAAPDLTASGEYNSAIMAIDADMHDESEARTKADADLRAAVKAEATTRHDEDERLDQAIAAVGTRVDNAEAEISANSADLTGIKSLTYGSEHVNFIESDNGEYSSPALEEIAEQMGQHVSYIELNSSTTTIGAEPLARLIANWPHVVLLVVNGTDPRSAEGNYRVMLPTTSTGSRYTFIDPFITYYDDVNEANNDALTITATGGVEQTGYYVWPYWSNIDNKPFSTVGTGLKVVNGALTVDTTAIPTGITANTTWGELES